MLRCAIKREEAVNSELCCQWRYHIVFGRREREREREWEEANFENGMKLLVGDVSSFLYVSFFFFSEMPLGGGGENTVGKGDHTQ